MGNIRSDFQRSRLFKVSAGFVVALTFLILIGCGSNLKETPRSPSREAAKDALDQREYSAASAAPPPAPLPASESSIVETKISDRENGGLPAIRMQDRTFSRVKKRLDPDGADSAKGTKPSPDKTARVWHRDAQRPTFARVYVGDNNSLELVSLQVTVTVEGPRARTLVDHIFRNPHDRQLEGTFEYPLPTGASPSYFAMFLGQTRDTVPLRFSHRGATPPLPQDALARLTPAELVKQVSAADWGRLQEARIVAKQKALETYEEIIRRRIDPALSGVRGRQYLQRPCFPHSAQGLQPCPHRLRRAVAGPSRSGPVSLSTSRLQADRTAIQLAG